jgi:hypothetical protein
MKKEEAKTFAAALNEWHESYVDVATTLKGTIGTVEGTKKLWREGKHSSLIKVGLTLIALPEPFVSGAVGSALVAAGLVQEGIRRRTLHVDDVAKTFQQTMRELQSLKNGV